MKNSVFIATSLDGYISDKNGGIEWLYTIPNPENDDMGYAKFVMEIDAIVMGRVTFETVLDFGIDWPYNKPVFVLSNTLHQVPEILKDKVFLVKGAIYNVLDQIHQRGFKNLYIDGGTTIRNFLQEGLIDEMILTTIPVLLGGGTLLFENLPNKQEFELLGTKTFLGQISQSHYQKKN